MPQWAQMRLRGVGTHKNPSETRQGQVRRAESLVNDREGLLEPRRGLPFESTTPIVAPGDEFKKLLAYQGTLIAHGEDTLYRQVSASSWTAYSGTYEDPDDGFRIQSALANSNLYLTTFEGLMKLDDVTSTPRAAGTPRPLDATYTLTGSSGFMADDTAVGYRVTLFYTDANDNEIESEPSQSLVAQNTVGGGATRNVALTVYIPSGLTTSYYWRVYRSAQTEAAADVPSEEMQVAAEGQLTSANISAGNFTLTDATPDALRGATAYFSPSVEGIASGNALPPLALDLCVFRGYTFLFDVLGRQRFFLNLLGTGDAALRYYVDATVGTTNLSGVLTGILSTATLRAGMRAKGTGVSATARIVTVDSGTQVTVSPVSSATATVSVEFGDLLRIDGVEYFAASATVTASKEFLVTTSGTVSQNLEATARAIVRVVNANASAEVYGYYVSSVDDTPGRLMFEEREIGNSPFQLSTTAPEAFSPVLPTTDNGTQISKADAKFNAAAISKFQQPEAFPIGQSVLCGDSDLLRGLALRDAIIVLSDVVGIITGTDISNFRYDVLDQTTRLIGPETAVVVNDAVYAMTNQGVVRISTQGAQIASRDIERELLGSSVFDPFYETAFGLARETDRCYELYIPTGDNDEYAKFAWRHNAFTEAWTHATLDASCGLVDPATDEVVLIDQTTAKVRHERRLYDRTDFADHSFAVTISGAGTPQTTITVNSTTGLLDGDLLVQSTREIRISDVVNGTTLLMAESATWSNGAATAYRPIAWAFDTLPWDAGEPTALKKATQFSLTLREALVGPITVEFATDLSPNFSSSARCTLTPADTGGSFSELPDGADPVAEQVLRCYIPRRCQYFHGLRVRVSGTVARERLAIEGYGFKARTLGADRAKGQAA